MSTGIVLVHGYSGTKHDLNQLAEALICCGTSCSVVNIELPGHGGESPPLFDRQSFCKRIWSAVSTFISENREVILIGHSTGGSLLLSLLLEFSYEPLLLVLASVPRQIDMSYLDRWKKHREGKDEIPLSSVAEMVSLINVTGSSEYTGEFPVLLLHGENDCLVPVEEVFAWSNRQFRGRSRTVVIPSAGHNPFAGAGADIALDIVTRAVHDVTSPVGKKDADVMRIISDIEKESARFLSISPPSAVHLARCPGAQRLAESKTELTPYAVTEPVFANIEITTHCNMKCRYCMRTIKGRVGRNMSHDTFNRVLELLPHAYRITLVGLGEPLMHPEVISFVSSASSMGRRVGLVTNAMLLNGEISRELLDAGLDSIAFSLDCADQTTADMVRPGTDVNKVIAHVEQFIAAAKSYRQISTAVFAAVSVSTVPYLTHLVDVVSDLGVHVLMLSDLNFRDNVDASLWKNVDDNVIDGVNRAVTHAFSKQLPVLSVRALEEFGLARRYRDFLLLPPGQLYLRSENHTWCLSPWQTVPVDVEGNVTLCDCQPEKRMGSLLSQSLSSVWNCEEMKQFRRHMTEGPPPPACRLCPRF